MSDHKDPFEPFVERIGGYLQKVTPVVDDAGKVIHNIVTPFQVEIKPRDIIQIIVGAYLLCVPVAFTEEVWVLSQELPMKNIYYVAAMSAFFVASFIYFNFYRYNLKKHIFDFIKRVVATYGLSLLAVALFLWVINKCPWQTDPILAIKRIILVAFPSSMAATLSDTIK